MDPSGKRKKKTRETVYGRRGGGYVGTWVTEDSRQKGGDL